MVILAAAALGAAGYGAYKGGEAAVKKGHQLQKEHERSGKRREQTSEFKPSSRQERIAKLTSMRTMDPSVSSSVSSNSSDESRRQKDVIASFRARQESTKGGGFKGLLKRGGK